MSTEDQVRQASEQFYTALNRMLNGDPAPLTTVWSHGEGVTAMHPIGGRQLKWDKVKESFEKVSQMASGGRVVLADQIIQINGETAWEVGIERGQGKFAGQSVTIDHRVTNIYRRESGGWKLVHHHTDISPAMVEIVTHALATTKANPSNLPS
jgi:ketosteroid isomerase-like protein